MVHQPIDEGWAWLVCLGASIQSFCVIGSLKTMGVFFVEILEIFDAPKAVTSLTLGLTTGMFVVFAMMTNALIVTVGPRVVTMCGAIMYTLSVFMASFTISVWWIIIFLGLMTGLAMGAMVTPSIIILSLYFDKHKSLANGLAVVGASIGQLILPYFVTWTIDHYGYTGAMLIHCAIIMHSIPAALLLRPVEFWDRRHKWRRHEDSPIKLMDLLENDEDPTVNREPLISFVVHEKKRTQAKVVEHRVLVHSPPDHTTPSDARPSPLMNASVAMVPGASIESINFIGRQTIPKPQPNPGYKIGSICVRKMALRDFCKVMFARRLVRSPCMWLMFFAMAFGHAGVLNAILHFPVLSMELFQSKEKGAMFVTIIAVFDLIGRVGGGWFSDLGYMSRSSIITMGFIIAGVSSVTVPFYPTLSVLVVYCILLGVFGGLYRILFPVIVGDLYGKQHIAPGVSMLFMSLGTVTLFVPTVLGYIHSRSGSYLPPYQFCGSLSLLAALFMVCMEIAKKYDEAVINPIEHDIMEVAVSSEDRNQR